MIIIYCVNSKLERYPMNTERKISGGQQEEGPGVVHHLQQEHYCQALDIYFMALTVTLI